MKSDVSVVAATSDGHYLFAANANWVRVFDHATLTMVSSFHLSAKDDVQHIVFLDGAAQCEVAVAGLSGVITLWRWCAAAPTNSSAMRGAPLQNALSLGKLVGHRDSLLHLIASRAYPQRLISCSEDGSVRWWDTQRQVQVKTHFELWTSMHELSDGTLHAVCCCFGDVTDDT